MWRHCNVKKHSGVSFLWQRIKMKLLRPSHGGSQPLCFPLLWTFLYPKYSILCTLVPFHFLHFPDFVLIPSFIWTPPTPLLKLCFKGQNRSAFFFKLSLTSTAVTLTACQNPIMYHFFTSLGHYHLLGAECRIMASQRCPHPNPQNLQVC